MRIATVRLRGKDHLGAVRPEDATVTILPAAAPTLDDVVRDGPSALAAVRRELLGGERLSLDAVRLAAPLRRFNPQRPVHGLELLGPLRGIPGQTRWTGPTGAAAASDVLHQGPGHGDRPVRRHRVRPGDLGQMGL
nr:hypothetical protein [Amycolatopsis balhimycina]